MLIFPQINIPEHAITELQEKYNMSPNDIKKAVEAYMVEIFLRWDEGVMPFFQFLENDFMGSHTLTNKH